MSSKLGWTLALLCVAIATQQFGLQGFAAGASLVVFWLLLQFSRALRVMRRAGEQPVGRVPSAVMLHARLKAGMPLLDVVALTRSLGERVGSEGDVWQWHDDGDSRLTLYFADGRLERWTLDRPPEPAGAALPETAPGAP